jgi:hypothetical protein
VKKIITYFICAGFSIFIFAFHACKKTALIEGKLIIKRMDNGAAVYGAKVMIFETEADSVDFVTTSKTPYGIYYSNSLGEVPLSLKTNSGKSYPVIVTCSRYFNSTQTSGSVIVLEKKTNYNQEITLYPEAFVKLHVRNTSPVNSSDSIYVPGCSSKKFSFIGTYVDTTFLFCNDCSCKFFGGYSYNLPYVVVKNSASVQKNFGFTTVSLDTVNVMIDY